MTSWADKVKIGPEYENFPLLNTNWHPKSTLVCRSYQESDIVGRYDGNKFIVFDKIALNLCRQWFFNYDKNLCTYLECDFAEEEDE